MNCPKCDGVLDELADEVDIGVGVQRFIIGWQCRRGGESFSACSYCGAPDFLPHAKWCDQKSVVDSAPEVVDS